MESLLSGYCFLNHLQRISKRIAIKSVSERAENIFSYKIFYTIHAKHNSSKLAIIMTNWMIYSSTAKMLQNLANFKSFCKISYRRDESDLEVSDLKVRAVIVGYSKTQKILS